MSDKRRAAMATIEAGLPSNALYIDGKPIMGPDNTPLTSGEPDTETPSLAPGPVDDLTTSVLKPGDLLAREKFEYQKSQDAATAAEKQRLGLQQQQQQQQSLLQQQKSALQAQAQRAFQASSRALGSVQNGIGSLSMPGGIGLPLATLLIMLMLLIPINGKTRFSWLWGVMTGNAGLTWASGTPLQGGVAGSTTSSTGGTGTGGGAPALSNTMYVPAALYLPDGEGVQL